jgi:hypothetical protein
MGREPHNIWRAWCARLRPSRSDDWQRASQPGNIHSQPFPETSVARTTTSSTALGISPGLGFRV